MYIFGTPSLGGFLNGKDCKSACGLKRIHDQDSIADVKPHKLAVVRQQFDIVAYWRR